MSSPISISRVHYPITTLGPGKRLGIWFQGCSIHCVGCISQDTWSKIPATKTVSDLMLDISSIAGVCEGITISGGEPFDQFDALVELVECLRQCANPLADILIYTGYPFTKLESQLKVMDGSVDAVISEPYEMHTSQTRVLLGSDNQQLHKLTPLGEHRYAEYDRLTTPSDQRLDLMIDEDGTAWMAGIPKKGDLERLRTLLGQQGFSSQTSEHTLRNL